MCEKLRPLIAIALFGLAATKGLPSETEAARKYAERWADYLPAWCLHVQAFPDGTYSPFYQGPKSREYRRFFGPTFETMHHYCWGLAHTHEASLIDDQQERNFKFQQAVEEFDYVLNRADDGFPLKPALFVQKGAAQEAVEDYIGAVTSYTDAIRVDIGYEPAYIGLSNCFEELGDPLKALAVIEAGLKQVPDSQILLARRQELASLGSGGSNSSGAMVRAGSD